MKQFAITNAEVIKTNNILAASEAARREELEFEEREERLMNQRLYAAIDHEEEAEKDKADREIIDNLAKGDDSVDANRVVKKLKRDAQRRALERINNTAGPNTSSGLPDNLFRLMSASKKQTDAEDISEDPLSDISKYDDYHQLFDLPFGDDRYDFDPWSQSQDIRMALVGGLTRQIMWERAVRSSVMGLWTKPIESALPEVDMKI